MMTAAHMPLNNVSTEGSDWMQSGLVPQNLSFNEQKLLWAAMFCCSGSVLGICHMSDPATDVGAQHCNWLDEHIAKRLSSP